MSALQNGAYVGTMLTGLSALTAAIVWTRKQMDDRRALKAARAYRYWNGYILQGQFLCFVRLVPDEKAPPQRVTMDVINSDGTPNEAMAWGLKQIVEGDGMISRSPSTEQQAFLEDLRRHRFGPGPGYPVN
jgi:hypothetical protein